MKKLALIAALLLVAASAVSAQDYGLPELHVIKTVTLAPTYGCRSQEEFRKGYQTTALFLSGSPSQSGATFPTSESNSNAPSRNTSS